jgi:hypothetical protein
VKKRDRRAVRHRKSSCELSYNERLREVFSSSDRVLTGAGERGAPHATQRRTSEPDWAHVWPSSKRVIKEPR